MKHTKPNIISHNHKKAVSYMKHTKLNLISHNHKKAVSYMKHTKLNDNLTLIISFAVFHT